MNKSMIDYLYSELIITLVVFSLPGKRQCEITGFGCVGEEILIDFENYYTEKKEVYIENGLLNPRQIEQLDQFSVYLEQFNGRNDDFYWDHEVIANHPLWENLRTESAKLLEDLFDVEYDVEIKLTRKIKNGHMIEHLERKLVKK